MGFSATMEKVRVVCSYTGSERGAIRSSEQITEELPVLIELPADRDKLKVKRINFRLIIRLD